MIVRKNLTINYTREIIHFSRKPPHRRRKENTGVHHPGVSGQVHLFSDRIS
jgi:hypothetical protein